jgi:hypothetical protein
MKSIRKDIVVDRDSIENIYIEKLILFQVKILSLTFIRGGELLKHLSDEKRFSESKTKFYAA